MNQLKQVLRKLAVHPLLMARYALWGAVVLAGLVLFSAGAVDYYQSVLTSPRYTPYAPLLLHLDLTLEAVALWLVGWEVAVVIVCSVIALVIVARRADEPMAYLISLTLFMIGVSLSYAIAQLDPWLGAVVITIGFCFLIIPSNVFPDGRHVPRWTRFTTLASIPFFLVTLPLQVVALDLSAGVPVMEVYGLATVGMMSLAALVLIGQVQRYRQHASPLQRQQTKFALMGITVGMALEVAAWSSAALPETAHPFTAPDRSVYTHLSLWTMFVAVGLHMLARMSIALGLGMAILRARLWNIDLVVNRSLVYSGASALVALAFLLVAYGLQRLLGNQHPELVMLLAVGLALGLFNPARQAVRHWVDRRLFGLRFSLDQLEQTAPQLPAQRRGAMSGAQLGAYRLLDLVGSGGMAEVYRAEREGSLYAVKVLTRYDELPTELFERFTREAELTSRLRHPNIVTVHTYGEQRHCFYMVMELIEGMNLYSFLKKHSPLPLETVTLLVERLADALDYVHSCGLVHRDLKPSNLMVNLDLPWRIKLMDFGIAKSTAATRITHTGAIGTIEYMAPEQIREAPQIDHRADVYALAVITYEMLTGTRPFTGSPAHVMFAHLQQPPPPLRLALPSAPQVVEDALLRGMAKEASDRFPSAGAFAQALGARGLAYSAAS
ncbi:MAG: serine/threonine-protein kinase [Anaerolinea sp.]